MNDLVRSPDNPRAKLARALRDQRKARDAEQACVVEGVSLVRDWLDAGMRARFVLLSEARAGWDRGRDVPRVVLTDAVMKSISDEPAPPGVIGIFDRPAPRAPAAGPALELLLDAIADPGNLGACLRVAAGAGCTRVWLAPGCVDVWHPKVIRGAMGAHPRLCLREAGWAEIGATLGDIPIYAADARGSLRHTEARWAAPGALIIGSEAHGLSAGALALKPVLLRIALANGVESLNAAVAAGVMLFEAARQRALAV